MRKLVDREGQPRLVRRAGSGCLTLLVAAAIAACTENPLGGDDQVTGGRRDISGEVVLSDGASPEGVVVWLQDVNLLARTNAAGRFRLTLPPQPKDQSSGTISEHTLYVYLANYQLAIARVAIVDGAFYYNPFAEGNETLVVCRNPLQRQIRVDLSLYALPAGRYRAYPYILVEPKDVPVSLLARIGQVNTLQSSYLQKPMRWQGGEFVLEE